MNIQKNPIKSIEKNKFSIETEPSFIEGSCAIKIIICLKFSKLKILIFFVLLNVIFPFLLYWSIFLRNFFLFTQCSLNEASYFWIENEDESKALCSVRIVKIKRTHNQNLYLAKGFMYRSLIYYYDSETKKFKVLEFDIQRDYNEILTKYGAGLTMDLYTEYLESYGKCEMRVEIPNIFKLFLKEIFSPINVFQIVSLIIWFLDEYIAYGVVVLILSISTAVLNLLIIRAHFKNISLMVNKNFDIEVIRVINYQKTKIMIKNNELVPGDVLILKKEIEIPCDCILLTDCAIVNESNISGEPTPKTKNHIPYCESLYTVYDSNYTLFEGSQIIQIKNDTIDKEECLALVIRTGFYTVKGELIRNIMYSTQKRLFYLQIQMIKYFFIMFVIALIGNLIKTLAYTSSDEGLNLSSKVIFSYFDLITVAIAPAMPTCVFIGVSISMNQLKKNGISCYSPYKLLTAGSINFILFDKTGTLTEKNIKLKSIQIVSEQISKNIIEVENNEITIKNSEIIYQNDLINILEGFNIISCCHNIYEIKKIDKLGNVIKELNGDNLELEMFKFSKGSLLYQIPEAEKDQFTIKSVFSVQIDIPKKVLSIIQEKKIDDIPLNEKLFILKLFEFNNIHQRMSVIVYSKKYLQFKCYVKGSVEMIKSLSLPHTIPVDLMNQVMNFSEKGYLVLAMAYKTIEIKELYEITLIERNTCESDLVFLGLLLFENPIKSDTFTSFKLLNNSGIKIKIVTGDSGLTALSVSKSLNMIRDIKKTYMIDLNIVNGVVSTLILHEDVFNIEEKPKIKEFNLFSTNIEKESNINYERLFLLKMVSHSNENYSFLTSSSNSTRLAQRRQVLSSCGNFLKEFISQIDILLKNDIAITGKAFNFLFVEKFEDFSVEEQRMLVQLLKKTVVFCRMLPIDKTNLVKSLQHAHSLVGMIGDGLNDIGALKCADVGLALSDSEMGLAASFSTKRDSILSCIDLLKEGRKTVVTIIHAFKYFSLYCLIQFTMVSILIYFQAGITNSQYLIQDLPIVTVLVLSSSFTSSSDCLADEIPIFDIFSVENIMSILGAGLIQLGGQIFMINYVRSEEWFDPTRRISEDEDALYEFDAYSADGNALFLFTIVIIVNTILTTGHFHPNRKPFYRNYFFVFYYLILFIYSTLIVLYEPARMKWMDLNDNGLENSFLWKIYGLGLAWVLILLIWEKIICNIFIHKFMEKFRLKKNDIFKKLTKGDTEQDIKKQFKFFVIKEKNQN